MEYKKIVTFEMNGYKVVCKTVALEEEEEKERFQEIKKQLIHLANKYPKKT